MRTNAAPAAATAVVEKPVAQKAVAAKNDEEEPESIDEDPRKVLAGSLLRIKINLGEVKAGTVNSDPPRSSWIQRLLGLIGRG